jgi:hypothetical protein
MQQYTSLAIVNQRGISQTQHLCYIKMCVRVGYMFRSYKRPSSGHPLENNSIKSRTHEMLARYGITYGFTKLVTDKNK